MKCPYCKQDVPDDVWHKCDGARASLIKLSRQCGKSDTIKDWMDAIAGIPQLRERIKELEEENVKLSQDKHFSNKAIACFIDKIHWFEQEHIYHAKDKENLLQRVEELRGQAIHWHEFEPYKNVDQPVSGHKYLVITTEGIVEYAQYISNLMGSHFVGIPSDVVYYAELPMPPSAIKEIK